MKYKILVFGAGAIGTYIGMCLLQNGHQVVFLERENDLADLKSRGLKMVSGGLEYTNPAPELISDLQSLNNRSFDLAILALKTYHLEEILPELVQLRKVLPPILSLQNGVESEKILRGSIGEDLVISGTITTAVDRLQKGNIVVSKARGIGIAGNHPLIPGIFAEFVKAGLNPVQYSRPDDMKWSKLILNLLGNSSSAILNMTPAEIYSDPELFRLERSQILETLKIMKFLGIKTVNLPGVPVKLLAFVIKYVPQILSQPILARQIGGGRGEKMPSFHIDLHSGKGKSEVEYLNGAVAKAGKSYNIPTPVNQLLFDVLTTLIADISLIKEYDHRPAQLINALDSNKSTRL